MVSTLIDSLHIRLFIQPQVDHGIYSEVVVGETETEIRRQKWLFEVRLETGCLRWQLYQTHMLSEVLALGSFDLHFLEASDVVAADPVWSLELASTRDSLPLHPGSA